MKSPAGRRLGRLRAAAVAGAVLAGLSPVAAGAPQAAAATGHKGDPTQYWNKVLLQTFRNARGWDASPGKLSRAGAMVYAAIYNAESAYQYTYGTLKYQPYLNRPLKYAHKPSRPRPDEEERLIDRTAYRMISQLFPGDRAYIDAKFKDRTGRSPHSYDPLDHLVVDPVVRQINKARAGDGSNNPDVYRGDTTTPGAWRPTGEQDCKQPSDAVTPNWGKVRPFVLRSGSQFRPPTLRGFTSYAELVASPQYASQRDEVRRVGAVDSTERTHEQTVIAWFWDHDLDGTYKPPGQMLQLTGIVAMKFKLDKYNTTRLFAASALALADAGIAAWDTKYDSPIKLWRPVSAIQATGGANATWEPLNADRSGAPFTPCFPAWTSGHANFTAAWAGAMKHFFGRDNVSFVAHSEDPHTIVANRTMHSFSQVAYEGEFSRLWLGMHYRWDAEDGNAIGTHVADYVSANALLPTRPCGPHQH
ncbi:vanadium-dependent haloperoxidase [Streptomyces carpinensis]|uniref:vanadium-dependent haloperoxidase n=1 Tax=Streptomyces carpinensis TaxID=66369 RepID=UPI001302CC18|nr:vanadium-dependent haloperoxidase [Streptomyces carpinensis]